MNKLNRNDLRNVSGFSHIEHFDNHINYVFKFDNGFGVSIIQHKDDWEMALIKFNKNNGYWLANDNNKFKKSMVRENLTFKQVKKLIKYVSKKNIRKEIRK
jgi:hypothetical protein